jgi:ribonucleoside-diphosphate reductase alpha chain
MFGPRSPFSEELHAMKYRQEGETFRDAMNRVASRLTDTREEYHEFRDILLSMRFMPAGRVQAAIGAPRATTPYNCYVSGTIPDSFTEQDNEYGSSIMDRAKEAAKTMRMGGGIGYDFSTLRPRGDMIRKLGSHSSGPISFMKVFDAVCKATASAGHRRGAQMGVMRIDHPDIQEFITVKHDQETLSGFNISVALTDDFMEHLATGRAFPLRFGERVYSEVDPLALWDMLMRSTWDWAEPGALFIDTINNMNNLYYCEELAATNPCGEQPLPPFGACLLGSFNLVEYIQPLADGSFEFDWDSLIEDIPAVVRAMDVIVDVARYPLPEQEREARQKRRMGLGYTALANAAETLGFPYGSEAFLKFEETVGRTIMNETYRASALLAKERGAFPLYDEKKYLAGKFVKGLDPEVRALIKRYGIRNSHLTSIAPTGTISMSADNVSSGLEPVFAVTTQRPVNTPEGPVIVNLNDFAWEQFGTTPVLADDVTADQHLAVLATAQRYVDSAVSKTCNVSPEMAWDDFRGLYSRAWELGCKGLTTFNAGGKRMALLTKKDGRTNHPPQEQPVQEREVVGDSCTFDPATGRKSCE